MTPKEKLQLAIKVVDYVNDVTPLGVADGDVAEIMLIAMQGLVGIRGTATICSNVGPKLG